MSDAVQSSNLHKRKRKKSFLKNARIYGKKGCYGRGSTLDSDTYEYFIRIMEVYREGFDSDEDKITFVSNVFEQTKDQEIQCCCNQVGCRVVEMLLPFGNELVMKQYMEAFSNDLRPLCSDRFASHVLETLVTESCRRSIQNENISEELKQEYQAFTLKISNFLLNNLEDYMWDTYANYVIRTCLENLAGIPKEKLADKSRKINKEIEVKEEIIVPKDYSDVVNEYAERIIQWPQFPEFCKNEITSGFLQVLLKSLRRLNPKLLKRYIKKLLDVNFTVPTESANDDLPLFFLSKSSIMLLETMIEVARSKLFSKIYCRCFVGRLSKLAKTKNTNFALQKLLLHVTEKAAFESMFDELSEHFKDIIEMGHSGVILSIGQACKRLVAKQGNFLQCIMQSFDCLDPEERQNSLVLCLARFTKFDNLFSQTNKNLDKEKLNLHGTLIIQLLLEFNKPIKIVNGLMFMETEDLKNLISNSMGSHIIDSYVTSIHVGEKSREKLCRKLKGTYQDLASSKYGSRSFEAVWKVANLKFKLGIMDELSYKDALWSNTEHGKIISNKINLSLYKSNKENWKTTVNKVVKEEKDVDNNK